MYLCSHAFYLNSYVYVSHLFLNSHISHRDSTMHTYTRTACEPDVARCSRATCVLPGGNEVQLHFLPDDVMTTARPGDSIIDAAYAAGVVISTGCNSGSCGACEVCSTAKPKTLKHKP